MMRHGKIIILLVLSLIYTPIAFKLKCYSPNQRKYTNLGSSKAIKNSGRVDNFQVFDSNRGGNQVASNLIKNIRKTFSSTRFLHVIVIIYGLFFMPLSLKPSLASSGVAAARHSTSTYYQRLPIFLKIEYLTHLSCEFVADIGTLILITGILSLLVNFVSLILNAVFRWDLKMVFRLSYAQNNDERKIVTFGRARRQLGEITAMGLQVLVVADVLETLTHPITHFTWEELGKIMLVTALRTVLSIILGRAFSSIILYTTLTYLLYLYNNREIKEIDEKIKETRKEITHTEESWKVTEIRKNEENSNNTKSTFAF